MIDHKLLNAVTRVVTHATSPDSNCPDGVASAIILNDALDASIEFVTHGPQLDDLEATPNMLFCDLTPPRSRLEEFVKAGAIVLDHHAQQRDIVQAFGDRGVFADIATEPGVSGAVLAFREVWMPMRGRARDNSYVQRAKSFATLAGIRDTWQVEHPDWKKACEQAEALRFYPWQTFVDEASDPFSFDGSYDFAHLLSIGPILIGRTIAAATKAISQAMVHQTSRGTRMLVVSTLHTSDVAEIVKLDADLVVGFEYITARGSRPSLVLSMRGQRYDVGAFCKSLDGGGHKAAAGAQIHVNSGDLNAYETITKLVEDWERGL